MPRVDEHHAGARRAADGRALRGAVAAAEDAADDRAARGAAADLGRILLLGRLPRARIATRPDRDPLRLARQIERVKRNATARGP